MTADHTALQGHTENGLSWFGILRLGLVQASLGAIVVLTTSTLNRIMVVELALPAMLPGILVGLHYMVQIIRPRMGYGSDIGGRRTPWIIGGMAVLALGGVCAAVATAWMNTDRFGGIAFAVLGFTLIGAGVSASGTSLLVFMATRVAPRRRAAAASIVWFMMIVGFIITTAIIGNLIDPYSPMRLVAVSGGVAIAAFVVTVVAVWGIEDSKHVSFAAAPRDENMPSFFEALREVWSESHARRFAIFVFISMLAFSAQDLILEPFAGAIFGLTPGESTKLSSLQNGGVLIGMLLVAVGGSAIGGRRVGSLRGWTIGGCVVSALALFGLTVAGSVGTEWPLQANVFMLGVGNGAFAVAAIGSMMGLAGSGHEAREGVRMGLWGAAQAVAFALGGFLGTVSIDIARVIFDSTLTAYAIVFAGEGILFIVAGALASRIKRFDEVATGQSTPTPNLAAAAPGR